MTRAHRLSAQPQRLFWYFLPIAAMACSDATAPVPFAPSVTTVAVATDSGSIFRTLHVALSGQAGIQVDYWADAAPHLRVVESTASMEHAVFLPGLRAGQVYTYEVRVRSRLPSSPPLYQGTLTTDTLPADLASLRFTTLGRPSFRLLMLELRGTPFSGSVILDQDGAVVWYRRGVAESFTRLANGDFVLLDRDPGITVVRPDLTVVAQIAATTERFMHHDVIATAGNSLLFLAHDFFTFDGVVWTGDAIWEWSPESGALVERWAARNFLSPDRDLGPRSIQGDWLHANSLSVGPRGNILVSLPAINQIVSIAPDFGSLEWRLGGPNATIVPDSSSEFWFEHNAQEISPNHVLLFDNGRDRPAGLFTRALELSLDPDKGTATTAWSFRPTPDIYAPIIGSSQRLANGHTVVNFGTPAGTLGASGPMSVYEVAPDGSVPWTLHISGGDLLNYRATPLGDIAGETIVEASR